MTTQCTDLGDPESVIPTGRTGREVLTLDGTVSAFPHVPPRPLNREAGWPVALDFVL